MTTPNLPLTISSRYFDGTKTTRSTNPKTIRRLANDLRRGDGDTIVITDAAGICYDVRDIGYGLQLIDNGDRVEADPNAGDWYVLTTGRSPDTYSIWSTHRSEAAAIRRVGAMGRNCAEGHTVAVPASKLSSYKMESR